MMAQYFELQCPSHSENVGMCRVAVSTFAANLGFSLSEIEEIKVAVSEAVSNVVVHAYPGTEGIVRLRCDAEEGDAGIVISVQDDGIGIADLEQARQASYSTDPERMGLGFVFMESFSDEFFVESAPRQGTKIRMCKRREAPAEEA